MQKAYKNLDIQFLPDGVVKEGIVANLNLEQVDKFQNSLISLTSSLHDSVLTHLEKLG